VPKIDFSAVKDHVFDTIKTIAPHDSQDRFEKLGVTVIRASARFIAKNKVEAGGRVIAARYFVIATGSRAVVPPIPGLDPDRVYTNETIFPLREAPAHLVIIGGGPIGVEMAQAHRRLGCRVSILDLGAILPRDDSKNVAILKAALVAEGIDLYENITIERVAHSDSGVVCFVNDSDRSLEIAGSHLLVAAGRKPNTEDLGLDLAGIHFDKKGISVDGRLRTNMTHVFAIGDVAGGPQFTHVAGYHAGIIISNICFKLPARVDYRALPWVTYTDPELAQVGLTEVAARAQYGHSIKVVEWDFDQNDRAIAARITAGQVRVITTKGGHILGASIVGNHAGELIGLWALAISNRLKISAVTKMIAPYPTLGEASKRAAGAWYTGALFSDRTRKIVSLLQRLPF
jgi:pyruvate/2-oxoglutarate dehydrogenase complex dihydrolipoamide dehydrogenase (E3) component